MSVRGGGFNGSLQHRVQSIGRAFEAQGLSRSLVEPQRFLVEVGLGELREVGSSREVLPQQTVGVLVAAALPRTAWVAEVDLHVGRDGEGFVRRHFVAAVPGQGAAQFGRQSADVLGERGNHARRVAAGHLQKHRKARSSFEQRHHVGVVRAAEQVAFPMAWNSAILRLGGGLRYPFASARALSMRRA